MTSRFADPAILQRAAKLSLRIIPKGLVGQVPIVVQGSAPQRATQEPPSRPRVLVIDDDAMIAWAWRKQQQRHWDCSVGKQRCLTEPRPIHHRPPKPRSLPAETGSLSTETA